MTVPTFVYHSVCDDDVAPRSPFVVRRSTFERQLAWLARRGYRTLRWEDVISSPSARGNDSRVVAITFDDGYADNLRVAAPLLLRHGYCATLFAVASFAQRRNWWDHAPPGGYQLLAPRELRALASCGVAVGSHGMTHRRMDVLPARARRAELCDSRHALEDVLGAPVTSLAWPYGAVDDACKEDAAAAGYDAAFAVHSGPLDHGDRFELRRVFMGDRAGEGYMRWKVSGVESAARWLRWRWSRVAARPPQPGAVHEGGVDADRGAPAAAADLAGAAAGSAAGAAAGAA